MTNFGIILALLVLFYLLGRAADLAILNIRKISEELNIKIFFLGLILGFFTSLPELAIGVNSIVSNVQEITLGNLLGGIMVLFGLILSISIILNRKISTDGKIFTFLPILMYLFLPMLLGLDGRIGIIDGIILIVVYLLAIYSLYLKHRNSTPIKLEIIKESKILKSIFVMITGLLLVVVLSNLIVRLTVILLGSFAIPAFFLGLILFSLGTNLPEIIVTVRSWKRHAKELSVSNLIGSAMANVLLIGIFASIKNIPVNLNLSYYLLILFTAALFAVLLIFYKTGRQFTRQEGFALLGVYVLFLISQIILI
ncbi:hypothetical protein KKD80_00170 [Patescibacteria group bacterium]|nr:hypothetical protein [Patescibacteria group bacterium]